MAKSDYFPISEGDLLKWMVNYKKSLEDNKTILGLTDAEVNVQKDVCDACINALGENTRAQATAKSVRTAANYQKRDTISAIRKMVRSIKTRDGYSQATGAGMGIIGNPKNININTAQPKLKLKKTPQGWAIHYKLQAFFHGIKIFRQRPGEEKKIIGVDVHSPFVDTDAMVNGTRYTAYFLIGDNSVGVESNTVVVEV